jgi:hypothetical protein
MSSEPLTSSAPSRRRSAGNRECVFNAGRIVFPIPAVEIQISLRIFGFDQNTVRRVIDLNGYFAEPFRFVGALHGIDFYFVTVQTLM